MADRHIAGRRSTPGKTDHTGNKADVRNVLTGLALALLTLAGLPAWGADVVTEERDVSGFTSVSFSGSGTLHITQTGTEALTIEAEPKVLEAIVTEVRGEVLHIRRKPGSNVRSRHPVRFDLSVADLNGLAVHGSGDTHAGRLQGGDFDVTVRGSADVIIDALDVADVDLTVVGSGDLRVSELNGAALSARISGSGDIAASGAVDSQLVKINGSGDLVASELKSRTADISVNGSGDVQVWTTDELAAELRGSGDVSYLGNPQVSSRISGSGEVSHRETAR